MSKRKEKYVRHLASALAVTLITPQLAPVAPVFAATKENAAKSLATPSDAEIVPDETIITEDDSIKKPEKNPYGVMETATYQLGLSVSGIKSKEWDGTDTVTGSYSRQLSGLVADHTDVSIDSMDVAFEDSEIGTGKTVIVSNITLKGSDASLYEMAKEEYEFETDAAITKRELKVSGSVTERSYRPGDSSATIKVRLANVAQCDMSGSSLNTGNLGITVTASYNNEDAGDNKPVTIDNITLSGSHKENYTITNAFDTSLTGTIKKAKRNAPALSYSGTTILGTDSSMEWRVNEGEWTDCTDSIAMTAYGTYEIRYKETSNYEASGSYRVTYGNGVTDPSEFYVDFKSGFVPEKEYDGTTKAPAKLTYGGVISGDDVSISGYTIEYASPNVSDNVEVTLSRIQLSGEDAAKYQPYADQIVKKINGKITQRTINVHVAAHDKDYDGTANGNLYICGHTSFVDKEDVDLTVTGSFSDANAGENKTVSIQTVQLIGSDKDNYKIGTITPAKIDNGNLVELDNLTATIREASQAAPSRSLFSVNNGILTGFTSDMEVLLPGDSSYTDCSNMSQIEVQDNASYVFRYKAKPNYKAGATTTINVGVVKSVTITFDLNGEEVTGEYPTTAKKTTGETYGSILMNVTPADTDREFVGWFTEPTGGTMVTASDICDHATDFTLYAHFSDRVNNRNDGVIQVTMNDSVYGDSQEAPQVSITTGDYEKYTYYYKKAEESDSAYTTTNPKTPGDYVVKVIAAKTENYNEATATASYTIKRRTLTLTFTPESREYNGTNVCGGKASTSGTIVSGDAVAINTDSLKATFSDKNVGTKKEVSITGVSLTGTNADYYDLKIEKSPADITPYVLNYHEGEIVGDSSHMFTVIANDKTYDGGKEATFATMITKITGDNVSLSAKGEFSDSNAGTEKSVTVTELELSGSDAGNYTLSEDSNIVVTGTIRKASNHTHPDISGTNPTLGKNNGVISGLSTDMEYSTDDGETWSPCPAGSLTGLKAGKYKVRYAETTNYLASDISVITLTDSSQSQSASIQFHLNGEEIKEQVSLTSSITVGSKFGTVLFSVTPSDPNREFVGWFTSAEGGTQITAETVCTSTSSITLYAHFKDKEQTSKLSGEIGINAANFTYGETPSFTAYNVTGDYSAYAYYYKEASQADDAYTETVPTTPGNYVVKVKAAETASYAEAETKAEFKVNARKLNVSVNVNEKTYDGSTLVYGYQIQYGNIMEADKGKIDVDRSSAKIYFADKNAGDNKDLSISGLKISGEKANCYELGTVSGTGKITKKTISADLTGNSKTYDGTNTASVTISSNGIISLDDVTFSYEAAFADSNEGTGKEITVKNIQLSGKDASNYSLSATEGIAYADITAGLHTISFNVDGLEGVKAPDSIKLMIGGVYPTLPELSIADDSKEFVGWFKADGTQVLAGTKYAGEDTLYAKVADKAEQVTYEIQYVTPAGDVLSTINGKAEDGQTIPIPTNAFRGYEYSKNETITIEKGKDNKFKVTCTIIPYQVTVKLWSEDVNTGEIKEEEIKIDYDVEHPFTGKGTLQENFQFVGYKGNWMTETEVTQSDTEWSIVIPGELGNYTVDVYLKKKAWDITYHSNGGEGTMSGFYKADKDALDACTFTKKGYSFKGWSTTEDGEVVYLDQAEIADIDTPLTLYAVWEATLNTVRFDLNGQSVLTGTPSSIQLKVGDRYPALPIIVSADPSKPFIGWFTADDIQVKEGDIYNGDLTLYAKYGVKSEGRIEISLKSYAYGDSPNVEVRVLSGDYDTEKINYSYRLKTGNTLSSGLPKTPGEYVVYAITQPTENTLSTTATCEVTVSRKEVSLRAENADKVYDGTTTFTGTLRLDGVLADDEVTVRANSSYDSELPGSRKLYVASASLTGKDSDKYKLTNTDYMVEAYIDKLPGENITVGSIQESVYGKADGAITGVDSSMEWRMEGESEWTTCPDGSVSDLPNGTYEIRKKETALSHAGEISTVSITSAKVIGVTILDADGSSQKTGIPYGAKLDKPADPVKSGYTFSGWYKDEACTEKWNFETDVITEDVTLYPKWVKKSSGGSGGSSGGSSGGGSSSSSSKSGGSAVDSGPGSSGVSGTWTKDTAGNWRFNAEHKYENEWGYIYNPYANTENGQSQTDWFHFGKDGVMTVGWYTDSDGNTYYLNPVSDNTMGRMLTGWNWLRGEDGLERCYYFETASNGTRGALYRSTTTPDGYTVDENGVWTVNGIAVTR